MGICPSKTKKRTTKSKNFGTVNCVLTNKHSVNNVVETKIRGLKGLRAKEVCNGGVACSLLKLDKPRPLLQNSLLRAG